MEKSYCEDCNKQVIARDSKCPICHSEYLQSIPKVIVQVSGGMLSVVHMDNQINLELRDYDIETTTDEEFKEHEQKVYHDENGDRYITV